VDRDALFWASVKDSRQAGDFEAYLRQFPAGTFAELARQRLAGLAAVEGAGPGASPALSAGGAGFDGAWAVTIACADQPGGVRGYRHQFIAEVQGGRMRGQMGEAGRSGSAFLSGTIEPDGSAKLQVRGFTADPRHSVGGVRPGTPYSYDVIDARFDGRAGSGRRVQTRPCELGFVRQGGR